MSFVSAFNYTKSPGEVGNSGSGVVVERSPSSFPYFSESTIVQASNLIYLTQSLWHILVSTDCGWKVFDSKFKKVFGKFLVRIKYQISHKNWK